MPAELTDQRRRTLGSLWMLGCVASFTLMAIASRAAGQEHDTFEIMLYRSLSGLVILLAFCAITGRWRDIGTGQMKLTLARNLVHFAGQNFWLYAIVVLPMAQVFAVEFTMPIWVLLFSPLLLGEKITRRGLVVSVLGFGGILIVTRPFGSLEFGLIAAALAAIGFALAGIGTRILTRTEFVISILFWLHLLQSGMALVMAGYDGHIALPTATSLFPLLAVGLLGLTAHTSLTMALSIAPAQVVVPVDYLRLPLIIAVGWFVYAEPADIWVFVGSAIILFANWLNLPRRS